MRLALLSVLLFACNSDPDSHIDASVHLIDAAKSIDAPPPPPPDAPPDAPNMNVVTACMHACDAIGVCIQMPVDPDCYMGCQTDLADCDAQQVATIDACSTEMCGDIKNNMSPLFDCITAVSCVDMALTGSRK